MCSWWSNNTIKHILPTEQYAFYHAFFIYFLSTFPVPFSGITNEDRFFYFDKTICKTALLFAYNIGSERYARYSMLMKVFDCISIPVYK